MSIKILYHGFVSPDRSSTNLLGFAHKLPRDYILYAMVLSNQPAFLHSLRAQAPSNLVFLPPVLIEEIVPFSNAFDIGLIPFSPRPLILSIVCQIKFLNTSKCAFVSSQHLLVRYSILYPRSKCGVRAKDFSVDSLLDSLLLFSREEIMAHKRRIHELAHTFSMEHNTAEIRHIVAGLLGE